MTKDNKPRAHIPANSNQKSKGKDTNYERTGNGFKLASKASLPKEHTIAKYIDDSIDIETDRYPFCIVWTPLPLVTWFIPLIGHTGVADSKGIIYDFSDDFNISVNNFSFGRPTKYYLFFPTLIEGGAAGWDKAIKEVSDYYSHTRHSLFFNNCHQYISDILNKVNYAHRKDWTQTEVWWKITFRSQYTGFSGFLLQWWPFMVIVFSILVFIFIISR